MSNNSLEIYIGKSQEIGGNGSVILLNPKSVQNKIEKGLISIEKSLTFLRLCLAEELFNQKNIELEITLIHEGNHILDFVQMISTFSIGKIDFFLLNSISAYLISAKYVLHNGENYAKTGLKLGLMRKHGCKFCINRKGILEFLEKNYRLSKEKQGYLLSEISDNLKPKKV